MTERKETSKMDKIYEEAKQRTLAHLKRLRESDEKERIESDRIFQYIQHTIDCLKLCIDHLPDGSETKRRYAMYKDELGELGDGVVKLTNPHRW